MSAESEKQVVDELEVTPGEDQQLDLTGANEVSLGGSKPFFFSALAPHLVAGRTLTMLHPPSWIAAY